MTSTVTTSQLMQTTLHFTICILNRCLQHKLLYIQQLREAKTAGVKNTTCDAVEERKSEIMNRKCI